LEEDGERFDSREQVHTAWKRGLSTANPDRTCDFTLSMVHARQDAKLEVQDLLKLSWNRLNEVWISKIELTLGVSANVGTEHWLGQRTL